MGVPIDPNSSQIIDFIRQDSTTDYISLSGTGASGDWGMPVYWATPGDPAYDVRNNCSQTMPPELSSIRIPSGARPDPTSDAPLVVIDRAKGLTYALWQASYDGGTRTWSSCGGTVYYASSNGIDGRLPQSDQPANFGHRGVPPTTFAVRYDEYQAGAIDHVLKISVNTTKCAHVFPMQGDECGTSATYAPPEGTRIVLKPSVDLSRYDLNPAQLMIARALQRYGAVIGDQSGGSVALKVENTAAEGRGQLWSGLLTSSSLDMFPLDDYEVVLLGYGG